MNDATPLTPLAHEQNSIFKCKQHTCTLHDIWGPAKYDYTIMYIRFLANQTHAAYISISETLLDNSTFDTELHIPNYNLIWRDRNRQGGGVCIFIRSDLDLNYGMIFYAMTSKLCGLNSYCAARNRFYKWSVFSMDTKIIVFNWNKVSFW